MWSEIESRREATATSLLRKKITHTPVTVKSQCCTRGSHTPQALASVETLRRACCQNTRSAQPHILWQLNCQRSSLSTKLFRKLLVYHRYRSLGVSSVLFVVATVPLTTRCDERTHSLLRGHLHDLEDDDFVCRTAKRRFWYTLITGPIRRNVWGKQICGWLP